MSRATPSDPSRGEDLISYWMRKVPLASVCTGALDGRSITPLKRAIDKAPIDEANRMRNYYKLVLMAGELRRERLMRLPAGELHAILSRLGSELEFPDQVKRALVDHAVDAHIASNDDEQLMHTLLPWAGHESEAFNPLAPRLALLDSMPLQKKLDKFRSALFGQHLGELISAGESRSLQVRSLCEKMKVSLEDVDIVELSTSSVIVLREAKVAAEALVGLITKEFAVVAESLRAVVSMRGKTSRTILVSIAAAIESSQWYSQRLAMFTSNEPLIMEWSEKAKDFTDFLASSPDASVDTFAKLEGILVEFGNFLNALPMELVKSFANELESTLVLAVEAVVEKSSIASEVDSSLVAAASKCVAEALTAFPMSARIVGLQEALGKILVKADSKSRLAKAVTTLATKVDTASMDSVLLAATQYEGALKNCVGLDFKPDFLRAVSARAEEILCFVCGMVDSKDDADADIYKRILDKCASMGDHIADASLKIATDFAYALTLMYEQRSAVPAVCDADAHDDGPRHHAMQALAVRSSQFHNAQIKLAPDGFHQVLAQLAAPFFTKCSKALNDYDVGVTSRRKKALDDAISEAKRMTNNLSDSSEPWHAKIKGADKFQQLAEVAATKIGKINPKGLDEQRSVLSKATSRYAEALNAKAINSEDDPSILLARKLINLMLITRCEINMIHNLGNKKMNAEQVRDALKVDVRDLRTAGFREKEVFHPSLFRRSQEALVLM